MKKHTVEMTEQLKLVLRILQEKLSRVLPFEPSEIIITKDTITVKE